MIELALFGNGLSPAGQAAPPPGEFLMPVLIILLLVLLNGLFVAAEFAMIGVRDTEMEQLADEGNRVAARVLGILESRPKLDNYLATAQLVVTLLTLGLGMYGVSVIGRLFLPILASLPWLGPVAAEIAAYIVAVVLLLYFYIVVGEMVPQALALGNPSGMVLALNRFMRQIGRLFSLPVSFLNGAGRVLLRLFNISPAQGLERLMGAEELELIVAESADEGLIEDDEEEIILNIFDFSERTVGQVMTPRRKVQALPVDCDQQELIHTVTRSRNSRFPVYEGDMDHIIGILHLKDLIRLTLDSKRPFDLRPALRNAPDVPEDFQVDRLLAAFKDEKLHMAVVRDEFGGFAGVVTLEDLVEEIVGEVRDEFDVERDPYHKVAPGVIEVAGDYLLDHLADDVYLGEEDDLPDVETVGGLIVSLLGRPPINGDVVTFRNQIRLTVLDIDKLAVARARIEFPSSEAVADEADAGDNKE